MSETLGSLIDKLVVVNLKLWHAEEVAHEVGASDKILADAKRRINGLNSQRNALIEEFDELMVKIIGSGKVPVFPQFKNYLCKGK